MVTYVNDLRLSELATGEGSGTWGTTTNTNLELIGEALGYGTEQSFSSDADATTTIGDGVSDPARAMYFKVTSAGSLTATRTLTIAPNTVSRVMFIENATTGSQSIAISQGSGANVTIATGKTAVVYLDGAGSGAAVVDAMALVDPGVTDTLTEVLVAGNTSGGTNIELTTTDKVQFRDSAIYINSSADGQLDIVADTEVQIAATTIDINGNLDVSGTTVSAGKITADAGIDIDNINIDGTTIALSSGNLTLDVAADIKLDADSSNIYLADGGTDIALLSTNSSDLNIRNLISDKDIYFQGNDGGSTITALTFNMSEAGEATFNADVLLGEAKVLRFGTDQDFRISFDGTNAVLQNVTGDSDIVFKGKDNTSTITALTLDMSAAGLAVFSAGATFGGIGGVANIANDLTIFSTTSGHNGLRFHGDGILPTDNAGAIVDNDADLGEASYRFKNLYLGGSIVNSSDITLDSAGDIILDADGGNLKFADGGTVKLDIYEFNSNLYLDNQVSDSDIIFQGVDGSASISALTLDMSAAGAATFNAGATFAGEVSVAPSAGTAKVRLTSQGAGSEVFSVNGQIPGVANGGFAIRNETDSRNDFTISAEGVSTFGNKTVISAADGVRANDYVAVIANLEATDGQSFGLSLNAGSNSSDIALNVTDYNGANGLFRVFGSGAVTVNGGAQAGGDFTVVSDSNANMLFVDSSTNRVGVGKSSPSYPLDVANPNASETTVTAAFRAGGDSDNNRSNIFIGQQENSRGLLIQGGRESGDRAIAEFILNGSGGTIGSNIVNFLQAYETTGSTAFDVTINQDGENIDFKVESQNESQMFMVDASADAVTIGKQRFANTPTSSNNEFIHFSSGQKEVAANSSTTINLFVRSASGTVVPCAGTVYVSCENSGQNVSWSYIIDFFYDNSTFTTTARATGGSQGTTTCTVQENGAGVSCTVAYTSGLGGNIRFNAGGHASVGNY